LHGLRIEFLSVEKAFRPCRVASKAFEDRLLSCEVRSLAVRSASLGCDVSFLGGEVVRLDRWALSVSDSTSHRGAA
jgi:hypothetical protein